MFERVRKRLSGRRGGHAARLAIGTAAAFAIGLAVASAIASGGRFSARADSNPATGCPIGMPASKCGPGTVTPTSPGIPEPAPTAYAPSPDEVFCGSAFFDAATASALNAQFGSFQCFRFVGASQWVVVADGMQTSGDGAAPGGGLVAVENCGVASAPSCLDANAIHSASEFIAFYPPSPASWPVRIENTFGSSLVFINDGSCGPLNFDTTDDLWYQPLKSVSDALLSTTGPTATIQNLLAQLEALITTGGGSATAIDSVLGQLESALAQAGAPASLQTILPTIEGVLSNPVSIATAAALVTQIDAALILQGASGPTPAAVPPPIGLAAALTQRAPASTGGCPQ